MTHARIHHGLDCSQPVRAVRGTARIDGWCFEEGSAGNTDVRLIVSGSTFAPALRMPRPEISLTFARLAPPVDSGFRFEMPLPFGVHEAQLEARHRADGWRTIRRFSIASEGPPTPEPAAAEGTMLAMLPRHPERSVDYSARRDAVPLNILFVMPADFASNQALHVISLARHLCGAGHRCIIASEPPLETLEAHLPVPFGTLSLVEARAAMPRFADGRGPDIVHAWTPRDNVRKTCEPVLDASDAALVLHLEDNEWQILSSTLGRPIEQLRNLAPADAGAILPWNLSHPGTAERFMSRATCATMVVDRLKELLPREMPTLTIWPSASARFFFPRPIPVEFRQALGIGPEQTVLFYHGNVHAANVGEMRALYEAVAILNEEGSPTTLIRTGENHCPFPGDLAPRVAACVLDLGKIKLHRTVADLMAIADLFVQPGEPDSFNDYRFPSKLPEFFSVGRPVILPRTNLGASVVHGVDAHVLEHGDARGIAAAIRAIRSDPQLAERLADGAIRFAATHFSWARNAEQIAAFYHEALARSREE